VLVYSRYQDNIDDFYYYYYYYYCYYYYYYYYYYYGLPSTSESHPCFLGVIDIMESMS